MGKLKENKENKNKNVREWNPKYHKLVQTLYPKKTGLRIHNRTRKSKWKSIGEERDKITKNWSAK